jgi:predicted nucleotidyltransferase
MSLHYRRPMRFTVALLIAFFAASFGARIASAASASFAARQNFATGANPRGIASGDLNGDGKLDLVIPNINSQNVSVLLNTTVPGSATSSYAVKQDFGVGVSPVSVVLADLNGDGKLDLIVANSNANSLSVLLNTTAPGAVTASFAEKQDVATSEGPIYVTAGDLNSDGKPDLVVVNNLINTLSVLLNTTSPGAATPTFAPKQDFATEDGPLSVALGDLNGDGKLDLATANFNSSTVSVLLNTTAPGSTRSSFSGIQNFVTGDRAAFVTMGDLNGDGRLDLAVANFISNTVSVLLNVTPTGAVTASFAANKQIATGTGPIFVTTGDVNGDGKLDLAVANFDSNDVSVLLNSTGAGSNAPSFDAKQDFATGDSPLFIAVDDLNGDGKVDLAVANLDSSSVSVLLNTIRLDASTPAFALKQDVDTGHGPRAVAVGDVNGDGKPDVVVTHLGVNIVSVLLNTSAAGATSTSFAPEQDFATGTDPVSITLADLNNDGKLDLAVTNSNSNSISVLLNTTVPGAATPSFSAKQDFVTGDSPLSITATDLNGDGKLDLVVADLVSTVSVLLNNTHPGATTTAFANKQDFPTGDGPRSVAAGDFNGDGKRDLAVVNFNSNTVAVLLNTTVPGAAVISFAPHHDFPTGVRPTSISVGDVNGDGKLDLAIANVISNTVSVLLNSTTPGANTPSFSARQDFATNFQPSSITAGDLNGDGKLDVAAADSNADSISVLVNTTVPGAATPSFAMKEDLVTSNRPLSIARGDLNSDGKVDLVVANFDADTVSVLLNSPTAPKINQTITFGALPNKAPGDPDFVVSATATSGLDVTFAASGQCTVSGSTVHLTSVGSCTISASQAGDSNFNPAPDVAQTFRIGIPTVITLSQANYGVNESAGFVTITVNRSGDLSTSVSVNYGTQDAGSSDVCGTLNSGLASSRCDFDEQLGTFVFAPQETQKTFVIPVTQDSYAEGPERFTVVLSKVSGAGATLGQPSSAIVTITDSTKPLPPNVNDDTTAFVRQQYRDFLNRDADPEGLAFWTAEIDNCTPKPECTEVTRVNASAAFFLSIEFQATGNLVRSFYVAALNRPFTGNMPAFEEFERDAQAVQRGVIVGVGDWEQILKNNRDAFMRDFVMREEFLELYPTTDTPAQYVDKLIVHARINPSATERNELIAEFGGAATAADAGARGRALLRLTDNAVFRQREMNPSFVQMQFFGYLRRNPNDAPDNDFAGFDFWLQKLNTFGGNFIEAEMVKSFLLSAEYRRRFGL